MSRLWDRGEPLDARIARFTVGRDPLLDVELLPFDALASAAHATMLARLGILDGADLPTLVRELAAIAREARAGELVIPADLEDGHTLIENRLIERLGDPGRRLHTGRSRNDQVVAALRLWGREALLQVGEALGELAECLLERAQEHRETTIPGYTHTRQAMPTTLGHLLAAHAELLLDAYPWLQTAFAHCNRCPLGSAAGYGVALELDRQLVSDLLAFDRVQVNTLAVQNDRGRTEGLMLLAASIPVTDLGRLAGDLILLSGDEMRCVRLAPTVTTGSSIMPQKRNPDVLELVRASAGRIRSLQREITDVTAPLTSGYHRDLQLTKGPVMEGLTLCHQILTVVPPVLATMEVDVPRCREILLRATRATDAVYGRVAAGVPFRRAYEEVARDPAGAVTGDELDTWRQRPHLGSPAQLGLDRARVRLSEARSWLAGRREQVEQAWRLLA